MPKGKRKQLRKRNLAESTPNAPVSPSSLPPPEAPSSPAPPSPREDSAPTSESPAPIRKPSYGPVCEEPDSLPGGCTIIPYNITIEEWTSGVVHLPQVAFDISHVKLSTEIYKRAATITEESRKSDALKPYFCGGEFDNVFMVEFGNIVCLSPITSSFRIQANQLLNLITDTGRNPYGNSIILEIKRSGPHLRYHCVSRKKALSFLSTKLAPHAKDCLEKNPLLRTRYWNYDPGCEEGVELFGKADLGDPKKWGYNTELMAFHYKAHKCHRARTHLKQSCPFYHSLVDARRPLSLFKYSSKRCGAGAEDCIHGAACNLSHNEYEHFYHPDFLRHSECMHWKQSGNCKGPLCSFFHDGEMTPPVGKKEPPVIALPASLSGIGPPGGLARTAARVPRFGLNNAPMAQSFSPSTRLRTSFSQEGIIFSLKDSQPDRAAQKTTKKKLSASGEVRPPGVQRSIRQPSNEGVAPAIKDSTLQCRFVYPDSELRDSEESLPEQPPISIGYQYQLKCQEVLVSYALCVLQKLFGADEWLASVTGFLLDSGADITLLDSSLWDFNLIRDIILRLPAQDGGRAFRTPHTSTNAVSEFFSSSLPANDEDQFHFWCYLVQILKMEAIHHDFVPVQALVQQFEEFVENREAGDVKVPTEHSLEYWQLFNQYMWAPPPASPGQKTFHILVSAGALPKFDHTAGALYLSHAAWDMVLDFSLAASSVLKDTFLFASTCCDRSAYTGYLNEFVPDGLDLNRMLAWFAMRPAGNFHLPEEYSRQVIGGKQDAVLHTIFERLGCTRIHCTVMAYDAEITSNPLLSSHVNHLLNTLNRLPMAEVSFTTFTDNPAQIRAILFQPKLRRSVESISFPQVCNGFQTVVDTTTLPISLPAEGAPPGGASVASFYQQICPYFQLLFLERRRFSIESDASAQLNWAKGGALSWQMLQQEQPFPLQPADYQACLAQLHHAIQAAQDSQATMEVQICCSHAFEAHTLGRQLLWAVHEEHPALSNLFTEDISPADVELVKNILTQVAAATHRVIVCMVDPAICNSERVAALLRGLQLPLVILHTGVAIPPSPGAHRLTVAPVLEAAEAAVVIEYLGSIVKENDSESTYTLARIHQHLAVLQRFAFQPTLFLYTVLFRLQKSVNIEAFVFERLDAARLEAHQLLWLMSVAFTARFADDPLEVKYLLTATGHSVDELADWVGSAPMKGLVLMDEAQESVVALNISVANEIIKWICSTEKITVADMTVRFIDSIVPRNLQSPSPLSDSIVKFFYRVTHEDSFTELISCLSDEDTLTILKFINSILPSTYSACGLARFMWTRGEQTEENTAVINELMEEAFTRCTNIYEQYYYHLLHGIMFATMFNFYVACSNSSNWRRILPVANNFHKRACSNFFKARGCLYGRMPYSTDYLIFPYILELSIRAAFLNYFLQSVMESMGPVKSNFQITNYYLVSSDKPSSLEDSRSICIELLHKLDQFTQFQNDPALLTAYKVTRDQSLVRASLDRVDAIRASMKPLLGDGQAHFIVLSDLCNSDNKLSYEIRRMSIWNLIQQYRKNKLASWYNAPQYVAQALAFIDNNVQPNDENSSFRDFDMVSWAFLKRFRPTEVADVLPILTTWCLKTTKLTNNHPIVANFYRYIALMLLFIAEPTDAVKKEAFKKSLHTCQDLSEVHGYPAEVVEYCHEFLHRSASLQELCHTSRLPETDLSEVVTFRGSLRREGAPAEWRVVYQGVRLPVSTMQPFAPEADDEVSDGTEPVDVDFSLMFSWRTPKAFNISIKH